MINVTVDDSKLTLFIDFSSRRMVQYVKQGINKAGDETAKYVKSRHLTGGTTEDRLGVRSGLLRKAAHSLKVMEMGDRITGGAGLGDGLIYAPIHIRSETFGGTKTTIRAKSGSLAIPLRGYGSRTGDIGYGRTKQPGPLSYPKGFLEYFKSKKGNSLLVHKIWSSKGKVSGLKKVGKGFAFRNVTIVPYYLLKKSVVVPVRVFPERIITVRRRYIVETIRNEMIKVFKRAKP